MVYKCNAYGVRADEQMKTVNILDFLRDNIDDIKDSIVQVIVDDVHYDVDLIGTNYSHSTFYIHVKL